MADRAHAKPQSTRRWQARRGEFAWRLAALLLFLVVANIGCDPISTFGFLAYPFASNAVEPAFQLTIPDKESKVVFICAHEDNSCCDDTFRDADVVLCRQLTSLLAQQFKDNKEKVKIEPVNNVYAYQRDHKDWITQPKREIGKHFGADFVAYVELGPMTMYMQGCNRTLYQGTVEVRMAVYDVKKPEGEGMKPDQFYSCTYPAINPIDAGSMREANFRAKFLDHIAKDLVPYFAAHPVKDNLDRMESDY